MPSAPLSDATAVPAEEITTVTEPTLWTTVPVIGDGRPAKATL